MISSRILALFLGGMIGFSPGLANATLMFQNGFNSYTGTQDTELREDDQNAKFETAETMTIDGDDAGGDDDDTHALLRFDNIFDPILPGQSIVKATLRLFVESGGNNISMHQILLEDWDESTATWITPFGDGVLVDANDTAFLRTLVGRPTDDSLLEDSGVFIKIDVTTEVLDWFGGTNNFGWAFTPDDPDVNSDGVDFATSENTNLSKRPKLTLRIVPEPGTLAIFGLGLAGLGYIRRRRAA